MENDLIRRHGVSAWLANMGYSKLADVVMDEDRFPSAQPETHDKRTESHACDLIDRQSSYSCSHEDDTICRRAAVDAMFAKMPGLTFGDVLQILHELPSAQPEPLTGKEKMIFLAAMAKEENICKQIDDEYRDCELYEDSLVRACQEIERKVRGALWT